MPSGKAKPLLRALAGEPLAPPPWWLMRQAGRYLPEYRAIRAKAHDFVELCLTPALAAELTLQPVRRYRMDGAILFSDILLLPHALGQELIFREGEGPVLEPIESHADIAQLNLGRILRHLEPVFEAVRQVAAVLDHQTTLIGFAGAPWTVATYMVEGGASKDFRRVKSWAYRDIEGFRALIDLLVEGTIDVLGAQIAAGAEVVQLFDSWAGVLPEPAFERWVIEPTRRIVAALKRRFPDHPVIGFPRGAGLLYERYIVETGDRRDRARHNGTERLRPSAIATTRYSSGQSRSGAADHRRCRSRNCGATAAPDARRRPVRVQPRARGTAGNTARECRGAGPPARRTDRRRLI